MLSIMSCHVCVCVVLIRLLVPLIGLHFLKVNHHNNNNNLPKSWWALCGNPSSSMIMSSVTQDWSALFMAPSLLFALHLSVTLLLVVVAKLGAPSISHDRWNRMFYLATMEKQQAETKKNAEHRWCCSLASNQDQFIYIIKVGYNRRWTTAYMGDTNLELSFMFETKEDDQDVDDAQELNLTVPGKFFQPNKHNNLNREEAAVRWKLIMDRPLNKLQSVVINHRAPDDKLLYVTQLDVQLLGESSALRSNINQGLVAVDQALARERHKFEFTKVDNSVWVNCGNDFEDYTLGLDEVAVVTFLVINAIALDLVLELIDQHQRRMNLNLL